MSAAEPKESGPAELEEYRGEDRGVALGVRGRSIALPKAGIASSIVELLRPPAPPRADPAPAEAGTRPPGRAGAAADELPVEDDGKGIVDNGGGGPDNGSLGDSDWWWLSSPAAVML